MTSHDTKAAVIEHAKHVFTYLGFNFDSLDQAFNDVSSATQASTSMSKNSAELHTAGWFAGRGEAVRTQDLNSLGQFTPFSTNLERVVARFTKELGSDLSEDDIQQYASGFTQAMLEAQDDYVQMQQHNLTLKNHIMK